MIFLVQHSWAAHDKAVGYVFSNILRYRREIIQQKQSELTFCARMLSCASTQCIENTRRFLGILMQCW